jgi:hypothetical protein
VLQQIDRKDTYLASRLIVGYCREPLTPCKRSERPLSAPCVDDAGLGLASASGIDIGIIKIVSMFKSAASENPSRNPLFFLRYAEHGNENSSMATNFHVPWGLCPPESYRCGLLTAI